MKENKISVQIVVLILGMLLTGLTTFYVTKGNTEVKIQKLKGDHETLEMLFNDFKDNTREDIKEIKEFTKEINSKIDKL